MSETLPVLRAAPFTVALLASVSTDLLTKQWADQSLPPDRSVSLMDDLFRLTLTHTPGVALCLLSGFAVWPTVVYGLGMLLLAAWLLYGFVVDLPSLRSGALGLICGGGLGNLSDRFADGRITVFLDFGLGSLRWPVFNLADTFIVTGSTALVLLHVLKQPTRRGNAPRDGNGRGADEAMPTT